MTPETFFDDYAARERFCYQLVSGGGGWQIAVLTPLDAA
jgi:hypothetical protein